MIPFGSAEEDRAAYDFSNLQDFLDIYYQGMAVLQTKQDFYDLTFANLARAAVDNARHVEIFFDPQRHTHRLILCFLRHLDEAEVRTHKPGAGLILRDG